jgi:hypothetical protein
MYKLFPVEKSVRLELAGAKSSAVVSLDEISTRFGPEGGIERGGKRWMVDGENLRARNARKFHQSIHHRSEPGRAKDVSSGVRRVHNSPITSLRGEGGSYHA